VKGDSMAKPEHLGIQKQLQRLRGRYDQLIRAVEQTADTVMITNRRGESPSMSALPLKRPQVIPHRSRDGSRLAFSAVGVLGDFDTLAVGHLVSFDLDRAQPHHTAVRVFREPFGAHGPGKKLDASPDLRYAGFNQAEGIRSYCFEAVASGHPVQHFIVTVDLALLLKHHIGVQEAPALCLRKLATDLKALPDTGCHELSMMTICLRMLRPGPRQSRGRGRSIRLPSAAACRRPVRPVLCVRRECTCSCCSGRGGRKVREA
jgi:hypothetical protein